jgi:hypothetical protein
VQAIYSKNSLGSFFDIKDFVMGVCLSTVTTFVQQPFPISRNKKDEDLSEIKYFNNSNSKNIDKVIEMIYARSAIEETVRKASPYKVEKIKQSTLDLKQDELNIRHSIGESVPTIIFSKIALNIKNRVNHK